jgi:hypothetical protein
MFSTSDVLRHHHNRKLFFPRTDQHTLHGTKTEPAASGNPAGIVLEPSSSDNEGLIGLPDVEEEMPESLEDLQQPTQQSKPAVNLALKPSAIGLVVNRKLDGKVRGSR